MIKLISNLTVEKQCKDHWCWAAVAVAIERYYGNSTVTQCTFASRFLTISDCCSDQDLQACDTDKRLPEVLKFMHALGRTFHQVEAHFLMNEIDNQRPVCLRIAFNRKGHAVLIRGYDNSAPSRVSFFIGDPKFDVNAQIPFESLKTAYLGPGQWTHTYFTKGT